MELQPAGSAEPAEPQFSVFEFEQAGLLHDTDGRLVASASALTSSQQQSPHSIPQSLPTSLHGLENAPQSRPQPWQLPLPGQGLNLGLSRSAAPQLSGTLGESLVSQSHPLFAQDAHNEASRWTNHLQHSAVEARQQSTDASQAQALQIDTAAEAVSIKQANREHQKRFRLRQKAKSEAVQAELDKTVAQLRDMKLQKLELEQQLQRNSEATSLQASQIQDQLNGRQLESAHPDLSALPPLTVSISGSEQQLSIEKFAAIPVQQFQAMWAEYMTEMTHCLARLDVQPDSSTEGRLQQLTFEAFMLAEETFRMRACDNNAKAMTLCRWHEHAPIPEHVYVKFLNAMLLADEQVKDLMFIRRVDYSKHHLLASQRKALAARIREGSPSPIANVNKLSAFATQLQQQALEDHDVVHRVSWAVSCGVLTSKQAARWRVQVGREHNDLLDYIAKQNGFPTEQEIVASNDEAAFEQEWNQFWQYTDEINPYVSKHTDYVPINKHLRPAKSMQLTLY